MTPRSTPSFVLIAIAAAALALAATGCGEPAAERLADATARDAPPVTPNPPARQPTPTPTPATANKLVLTGDIAFEDLDPEVVLTTAGERIQIELRHREPGSAAPDSTLYLLEVPAKSGTYAVHAPATPPVPGRVAAFLTSRTERVGTMKDFTAAVRGTLTLREETPGVIFGTFQIAAQEAPPPPPVVLPGIPTPSPSATVGKVPPPPPAVVQAPGSFLAMLSDARAAAPAPPPLPSAAPLASPVAGGAPAPRAAPRR